MQNTRSKKSDSDEMFEFLFDARNIDKIVERLSSSIQASVEKWNEKH